MALPSNRTLIPKEWKRWIAENVLRGGTADDLAPVLVKEGFSEELARSEVDAAISHPYIDAAKSLDRKRQKQEWVFRVLRRLRDMDQDHSVPRLDSIAGEDFFRAYYSLNRPVVLTAMISQWPALRRWNERYLTEKLGGQMVEIQTDRDSDPSYEIESNAHRARAPFSDFAKAVFSGVESNNVYMTANNSQANAAVLHALRPDMGSLPQLLEPDPACERTFFWMGPAGIVTPAHHDLTNNLMAQIVGRKRVLLVAPENLPLLYNHFHCFTRVDFENVDLDIFPLMARVKIHEVTLCPGEILFLPIGWWHHVRGLDPTITITYTNFPYANTFHDIYHTYEQI